ncbi:hypothetical protein L1887_63002 [Cichorium endivia]|nr:hypothetical protein L1887_63002 [Cichorium endivia]
MKHWAEIADEVPGLPLRWDGSLNWNMEDAEMDEYLENHSAWGYGIASVERSEIKDMEPSLDKSKVPDWGLYAYDEGTLEAAAAALMLTTHAEETFGATLIEDTVAGFLHSSNSTISGVLTSSGQQISADHVVLAAGLGSVPLLAAEGIELPLDAATAC